MTVTSEMLDASPTRAPLGVAEVAATIGVLELCPGVHFRRGRRPRRARHRRASHLHRAVSEVRGRVRANGAAPIATRPMGFVRR
jgi:hypothetical protein